MENMDIANLESKPTKESLFFQLFMSSQKNLYAYILASVHNFNDAEDIMQETAAVMWQNFDKFDPDTNFLAWAISIARNMVRNYFSSRKKSRLQFDDSLMESIEQSAIRNLERNSMRIEALKRCCEKLSESSRLLIQLRYEQGMTVKSIASRFGRPIAGMYKALARLQDALLECTERIMAVEK